MRRGPLAVLRGMQARSDGARASLVRTVRTPVAAPRADLPGLPSALRDVSSRSVRLLGAGPAGHPQAQVLGVARREQRARRRHGLDGTATGHRRGDVGAARAASTCGARVRPSSAPRPRGGRSARASQRRAPAAPGFHRAPVAPVRRGSPPSARGRVRGRPPPGPPTGAPRRRRADHGRHGCGLCGCAALGGGERGASVGRGAVLRRECLYSGGPSSGSVVARGFPPVVDASRGRNDPRKATVGR